MPPKRPPPPKGTSLEHFGFTKKLKTTPSATADNTGSTAAPGPEAEVEESDVNNNVMLPERELLAGWLRAQMEELGTGG